MLDREREDAAINRFWNALVDGSVDAAPDGLDPSLAETLRRLDAMTRAPVPRSAQARSLGGGVMPLFGTDSPMAGVARRNNHSTRAHAATRLPRLGPLAVMAGVMLFVLALGGWLLLIGPGAGLNGVNGSIDATATPAITAASPAVSIETYVSIDLPADLLPSGTPWIGFTRTTFAPGASASAPAITSPSIGLDYVLSGSYSVRIDAATRVFHRNAKPVDVPAGTNITLNEGDAALYLNGSAASAAWNDGSSPAVILNASMYATPELAASRKFTTTGQIVSEELNQFLPDAWQRGTMPPGPLLLTFRRVTLAARAALPPTTDPYPAMRWLDEGQIGWSSVETGATPEAGAKPMQRFSHGELVTLPWGPAQPGRQIVWSNPGNAPAVLLEFIIAPASASNALPP